MRKIRVEEATELTVRGVEGFFEKSVTKFGSGAKIDCPKQYLGRAVYVVIRKPGAEDSIVLSSRSRPRRPGKTGEESIS
jgi:putative transposon-encoded protein